MFTFYSIKAKETIRVDSFHFVFEFRAFFPCFIQIEKMTLLKIVVFLHANYFLNDEPFEPQKEVKNGPQLVQKGVEIVKIMVKKLSNHVKICS